MVRTRFWIVRKTLWCMEKSLTDMNLPRDLAIYDTSLGAEKYEHFRWTQRVESKQLYHQV